MKVVVDHAALRRALDLCRGSVARQHSVVPILKNVRLIAEGESLNLGATDLEMTVLTSVDAVVSKDGGTTVETSALFDVVKNATAPLTMTAADGRLLIATGTARYELNTLPIDDYPTLPEMDDAESIEFSASEFLPMLRTCSYPMCEEETRYQFAGILVAIDKKRVDVTASDGHRLALASLPGRFRHEAKVMLHETLVRAAEKLSASADGVNVSMVWTNRHAGLSLGRDTLLHRSLDVHYPDYRAFIPIESDQDVKLRLGTAEFLSAVRSVAPFGSGTAKTVAVQVARGSVRLSTRSIERGGSDINIAADYDGAATVIGFPARFLIEATEAVHTERISITLNSGRLGESIAVIAPEQSALPFEVVHLAFPIRLDWEPK